MTMMKWNYGVTTVPQRRKTTLPETLASLRGAGFDAPRLFVDCERDAESWRAEFNLEVSARWPRMYTAPSWVLAAWEMYLRDPQANRFVIFQDDILVCKDLKAYLEAVPYPAEKCYCNLFTHDPPLQQPPPKDDHRGWFLSNQLGKGALALMFDRLAMMTLLTAPHIIRRQGDCDTTRWRTDLDGRQPQNREKAIDGGIVDALGQLKFVEYVHYPSLVQHTGHESTMNVKRYPQARSFPGSGTSALSLLPRFARPHST